MLLRIISQPSIGIRLLLEQRRVRVAARSSFAVGDVLQLGDHQHEADFPLGNALTTRVRRLISPLSRSIVLFVRVCRQCSRGISQYVSDSAKPSQSALHPP